MSKVFITQIPHRKDNDTGAFVPTVNIAPATEHGEPIIMMPPQAAFYSTSDLTTQLRKHLIEYNYDDGDSIIALGDPSVMAVAFAIIGKEHGKFRLLKWDRNIGRYIQSHISV